MALILRYVDVLGEGFKSICWSGIFRQTMAADYWEAKKEKKRKIKKKRKENRAFRVGQVE